MCDGPAQARGRPWCTKARGACITAAAGGFHFCRQPADSTSRSGRRIPLTGRAGGFHFPAGPADSTSRPGRRIPHLGRAGGFHFPAGPADSTSRPESAGGFHQRPRTALERGGGAHSSRYLREPALSPIKNDTARLPCGRGAAVRARLVQASGRGACAAPRRAVRVALAGMPRR
jgi:hypothetical protein